MQTCSSCGAVYADTTGSDCPVCHEAVGTNGTKVSDFAAALFQREREEESRLEQLIVERWTGKDGERE